jgi:hypothetical protein
MNPLNERIHRRTQKQVMQVHRGIQLAGSSQVVRDAGGIVEEDRSVHVAEGSDCETGLSVKPRQQERRSLISTVENVRRRLALDLPAVTIHDEDACAKLQTTRVSRNTTTFARFSTHKIGVHVTL